MPFFMAIVSLTPGKEEGSGQGERALEAEDEGGAEKRGEGREEPAKEDEEEERLGREVED